MTSQTSLYLIVGAIAGAILLSVATSLSHPLQAIFLAIPLSVLVLVTVVIGDRMAGWKRTATTSAPSNKCEKCSDGELSLIRVPRRSRWVRALGYVIVAAPVVLLGPNVMNDLQILRSVSIDPGYSELLTRDATRVNIVAQVFVAAPVLLVGGFLAFPFKKSVWHCKSCGHILEPTPTTRTFDAAWWENTPRLKRFDAAWWEQNYQALVAFKAQEGHCNVPQNCPENPQLGTWLNSQRTLKRVGKLFPDRIARLDALGVVWDLHEKTPT